MPRTKLRQFRSGTPYSAYLGTCSPSRAAAAWSSATSPSRHRCRVSSFVASGIGMREAAGATVHDTGLCTLCAEPGVLFSHRRDGGTTGRQAAIAWR